jgi:hypothetical protein
MTSDSERTFDKVLNNHDPFTVPLHTTHSDKTFDKVLNNPKQKILYDNPFKENNPYQDTQNEYWKYFVIDKDYKVFALPNDKAKIIEGLINIYIYRIDINYTEITVSYSILNIPLISAYLFPIMFSFS